MEHTHFPLFVDVSQKKIVVIGGGRIATRRVQTLLLFAEHITVTAPETTDELQRLAECGRISHVKKSYDATDIREADMILAATDSREVNRQIAEDCRMQEDNTGRQILLNVADDKTRCDFYFPSVIEKDDIVIAVSSGGKNPGKVKVLREKIAQDLEESK